jgi:transmembrane sensor
MEHMDQDLLRKFTEERCTPEEYERVLQWLDTPDGKAWLEENITADLNNDIQGATLDAEKSAALYNRIQASTKKYRWLTPLKVAAMVAGIAALAYLYHRTNNTVYHTEYGEIRTVTLPDQSVVTLNGNSTLRYSRTSDREVWIEGEAFFNVKSSGNPRPFLVHTASNMEVQVLGTSFNLVDRHGRTQVVLNTGKVRLISEKTKEAVVLKPGDLVEYKQQVHVVTKNNTDTRVYSSWKQDNLQFENVSFAELAQLLEDTYGVKVEIRDSSLLQQRFTGTIPNRKMDVLLNGLSQLFHLKIVQNNNEVIIEKQ